MTGRVYGRVVQLYRILLEVFDHLLDAGEGEVLYLTPGLRYFHSQVLCSSFIIEREHEFALFCVGFSYKEAAMSVRAAHSDVGGRFSSRYLTMKPRHGQKRIY